MLTWFYLSGLAILIGAELNAEIEHASPYGKAPGEKMPGEKRKIGVLAEREFEKKKAEGGGAAARGVADRPAYWPPPLGTGLGPGRMTGP